MLILILIDVQYLQNVAFSSGKGSNGQNLCWSDSYQLIKNFLPVKFPIHPLPGEIPLPLNAILEIPVSYLIYCLISFENILK